MSAVTKGNIRHAMENNRTDKNDTGLSLKLNPFGMETDRLQLF
jgi:hypothetical protein